MCKWNNMATDGSQAFRLQCCGDRGARWARIDLVWQRRNASDVVIERICDRGQAGRRDFAMSPLRVPLSRSDE